MIKAILIDLDGTILDYDQDLFLKHYLTSLSEYLNVDKKELSTTLLKATELMVRDTSPNLSNEQKFFKYFSPYFETHDKADFIEKTTKYYNEVFDNISLYKGEIRTVLIDALKLASRYDIKLVLATNPVFPAVATYKRISWAGLDRNMFSLITTYENSNYCKPNVEYYQEILTKINLLANEVVMIGNDTFEDLVAIKLGIETFLLVETVVEHEKKLDPKFKGDQIELKKYIKSLILRNKKSDKNVKQISITTSFITLGQFLKLAGIVSSGSEAKEFLKYTRVYVNEELESRRGRKIYPLDIVKYKNIEYIITCLSPH